MSGDGLIEESFAAFDEAAAQECRENWDSIAKPLYSLGKLEEALIRIAGITGDARYSIGKRVVLVLCADNGVVCQGTTQTGSEVTANLARGISSGSMTVNKMAATAHADVVCVDMGVKEHVQLPDLIDRRIAPGTQDISQGPAMSREEAVQAIRTGIDLVGEMKDRGYRIICTGEAGIGNTTTSSAIASVLLDKPISQVTGRGAGLSSERLVRKMDAIQRAIECNDPNPSDAFDTMVKLGGFDIAGLCGVFLGGAIHRVPVLVDGLISSVAALCAARMYPQAKMAMLASHISAEPACAMLLDELELDPLICAGMHVGEGTGAVAALPLLDMAYSVYDTASSFDDLTIEQYTPQA